MASAPRPRRLSDSSELDNLRILLPPTCEGFAYLYYENLGNLKLFIAERLLTLPAQQNFWRFFNAYLWPTRHLHGLTNPEAQAARALARLSWDLPRVVQTIAWACDPANHEES